MFSLIHEAIGYDGSESTLIGVSDKKETLQEIIEVVKTNRKIKTEIRKERTEAVGIRVGTLDSDIKRRKYNELITSRQKELDEELDELYPTYGCEEGFQGEDFVVERTEVFQ